MTRCRGCVTLLVSLWVAGMKYKIHTNIFHPIVSCIIMYHVQRERAFMNERYCACMNEQYCACMSEYKIVKCIFIKMLCVILNCSLIDWRLKTIVRKIKRNYWRKINWSEAGKDVGAFITWQWQGDILSPARTLSFSSLSEERHFSAEESQEKIKYLYRSGEPIFFSFFFVNEGGFADPLAMQ